MRVALVYDRVNKWGGAERFLLALSEIFPQADLFTSVYEKKKALWAKVFEKNSEIKTSFLQNFPKAKSFHQAYASLMPLAFESLTFDNYDLVISITSEAAKGIITKPSTFHLCLCLTPTRYIWSGYEDYFKNRYLRFFSKPIVFYLKSWDKIASQRPDALIAISEEVKSRIKKYYKRDSEVIYPPVTIKSFLSSSKSPDNYFLIVSRLVPYKKIELAIKACNELSLPLKIVGIGQEESMLKSIAGETIEFLGELTDEELSNYYKNCKALIFPGIEDFGLVIVEAQSFGKPVIAFKGGGALEIVKEGKTGEFFENQTVDSLRAKLAKFDHKRYNSRLCIENAERFSYLNFKSKIISFLENKL